MSVSIWRGRGEHTMVVEVNLKKGVFMKGWSGLRETRGGAVLGLVTALLTARPEGTRSNRESGHLPRIFR